jgi:hypothetical protein
MKIKKFLIFTIIAFSILCCFSGFATDKNNDTCVTNFLSLKPADNYSFLIAKNDVVPSCSRCGGNFCGLSGSIDFNKGSDCTVLIVSSVISQTSKEEHPDEARQNYG